MPEECTGLCKINWTQTFPFLRLFRTFGRTMNYTRLALALACVVGVYLGGRVLDQVWKWTGNGVAVQRTAAGRAAMVTTEVGAFANCTPPEFRSWRDAAKAQQDAAKAAVTELEKRTGLEDRLRAAPKNLRERLRVARADIKGNKDLKDPDREAADRYLARHHDEDRLTLGFCDPSVLGPADAGGADLATAAENRCDPNLIGDLTLALTYARALGNAKALERRGPFGELLNYEMNCFGQGVRAVCAGRLGFATVNDPAGPALVTSIANAGSGVAWLVTQRPCFALFMLVLVLAASGLFGGAICRHAAVDIARDESLGLSRALAFSLSKWKEFVLAPLLPIALIAIGGLLMAVGGLIGAIPWFGHLISGVLFVLAILGGFVLALALIGLALGGHLMWPTIAVESSDAFDAVTRAFGYVGQRIWHSLFYCVSLLTYGGLAFVLVRLVAMVSLKFAHACTGLGMSFFGALTSSQTYSIAKLDAMWHMPAWTEMSLLPTAAGTPFWGQFGVAPLSGTEWVASGLIAIWVYLFVSLVGAFVVGFFFCGSTEAYFLLRRDLDATDFDEVFYEEESELEPPTTAAGPTTDTAPPAPPASEPPPAPVAPA